MRRILVLVLMMGAMVATMQASMYSRVRGVVHDGQHQPVAGAVVELRAVTSSYVVTTESAADGTFAFAATPLGSYRLTVRAKGFAVSEQELTLAADTAPVVHMMLHVETVKESVNVPAEAVAANVDTATPESLVGREEIAETPGASLPNSMAMITDYTPGAYMSHDMLHMRGGHQVGFAVDGVLIPNTNIAENLAAPIAPTDVEYLEVERGSYAAGIGDRTYGVFNVVPRTGFERNREAELAVTAGNLYTAASELSLGDHTERSAYYASVSGNRSNYGLEPPVATSQHDASNGYGGFGSWLDNRTAHDQLRAVGHMREDFFQVPYDPDANDWENQQYNSSALRDVQHETDAFGAFTWLRTTARGASVQVSPFYHFNRANYDAGNAAETPVATTYHRASNYGGAQAEATEAIRHHTLSAGLYAYGQHDTTLYGVVFNDGSGNATINTAAAASGGVVEEYASDTYKPRAWLTLTAGLRATQFRGDFTESVVAPRFGAAVQLPKSGVVLRGFYGRFYQPPPLVTVTTPLAAFATANNTGFAPLHGERDEEHQFGVQIPWRGWLLDADNFKTRANNFLDHSNVGDSSIFFPITVDGALVRAWELTVRSPELWRGTRMHVAYSNQIAEQRGNITGGLVCAPVGAPQCDAGFAYTPVDHDQRNTLTAGFESRLPKGWGGAAEIHYGSGFVNGLPGAVPPLPNPYPNAYLPEHTTFDVSVTKTLCTRATVSVTALNAGNLRVLQDNSLTFGGFHYNDPRQVYGSVRWRFKY